MLTFRAQKRLESSGGTFRLDACFEIREGLAVLTGPSGAGKTTILNIIAGILRPDEGKIVLGENAFFDSDSGLDLPMRWRRVGMVFQDYALFPHMSALENVAYGVRAKRSSARFAKAREMMDLIQMPSHGDRLPRDLSGGERQRVALARALASEPAIILLDEPLSAVDQETRAALVDEIVRAQKSTRIPFIYVTHNPGEVARFANKHLRVEAGRVFDG